MELNPYQSPAAFSPLSEFSQNRWQRIWFYVWALTYLVVFAVLGLLLGIALWIAVGVAMFRPGLPLHEKVANLQTWVVQGLILSETFAVCRVANRAFHDVVDD